MSIREEIAKRLALIAFARTSDVVEQLWSNVDDEVKEWLRGKADQILSLIIGEIEKVIKEAGLSDEEFVEAFKKLEEENSVQFHVNMPWAWGKKVSNAQLKKLLEAIINKLREGLPSK